MKKSLFFWLSVFLSLAAISGVYASLPDDVIDTAYYYSFYYNSYQCSAPNETLYLFDSDFDVGGIYEGNYHPVVSVFYMAQYSLNIYQKGKISFSGCNGLYYPNIQEDYCINQNYLKEYWVIKQVGNTLKVNSVPVNSPIFGYKNVYCKYGCYDGACKPK